MNAEKINYIKHLLRQEIVPATGCTEPAALALAVAYTANLLDVDVEYIKLKLSANMIKNVMGVGIPSTGMIGAPIAIALAWYIRDPQKKLEILDTIDDTTLSKAKKLVNENLIDIKLKDGDNVDKLYIEVEAKDKNGNIAKSKIITNHSNLVELSLDGIDMLSHKLEINCNANSEKDNTKAIEKEIKLRFEDIYNYAMTVDLADVEFIYEATLQNYKASEYAQSRKMGHDLGHVIQSNTAKRLIGESPMVSMLATTSFACDARMDGAPVTVVSNSGSGNQGLTATLPVYSFALSQGKDKEITLRALVLSSLLVIFVKSQIGRLSALCGMIYSAIGTAAAVTYLMGGNKKDAAAAVNNTIASITGMICDGAKASCSIKASVAISTAMISAIMSMENSTVNSNEGIIDDDIDLSISNLARIGREAMANADATILDIMTNKNKSKE